MNIKITKDSLRTLTGLKRLPKRFRMFVAGSWLYDVLKANGLHEKIHLWNQTYWVTCRSLNAKLSLISWRVDK
jgi:hypothetical protein